MADIKDVIPIRNSQQQNKQLSVQHSYDKSEDSWLKMAGV